MSKAALVLFVVDDDDAVRSSIRLLALSFGWQVSAYASGQECMEAVAARRPDCLLLDLNMPGMDGPDVQQALRRLHIDIPVVAMTGETQQPLTARARAAGAAEVLEKPFREAALWLAVQRATGPSLEVHQ